MDRGAGVGLVALMGNGAGMGRGVGVGLGAGMVEDYSEAVQLIWLFST